PASSTATCSLVWSRPTEVMSITKSDIFRNSSALAEFATIVEEMFPVRMNTACSGGGGGSMSDIVSAPNERAAANIAATNSWLESGSETTRTVSSLWALQRSSIFWNSGTSCAVRKYVAVGLPMSYTLLVSSKEPRKDCADEADDLAAPARRLARGRRRRRRRGRRRRRARGVLPRAREGVDLAVDVGRKLRGHLARLGLHGLGAGRAEHDAHGHVGGQPHGGPVALVGELDPVDRAHLARGAAHGLPDRGDLEQLVGLALAHVHAQVEGRRHVADLLGHAQARAALLARFHRLHAGHTAGQAVGVLEERPRVRDRVGDGEALLELHAWALDSATRRQPSSAVSARRLMSTSNGASASHSALAT